jgi:hypothetical protein
LQFAKAGNAATLPQLEKNNSADVQWNKVNITSRRASSSRIYVLDLEIIDAPRESK